MKPNLTEQIVDALVKLLMFGISVFAVIQGLQIFFKERSVGKTAMNKLKEEHKIVRQELEAYKKEHAEMREDIEHIESKYEKLIEKILNNFPFNK